LFDSLTGWQNDQNANPEFANLTILVYTLTQLKGLSPSEKILLKIEA
jgi:hypothetical protein